MNVLRFERGRTQFEHRRLSRLGSLFVSVCVLSTLLSSVSWAGPCTEVARTYCVAGTSTPLDWHWSIPTPTTPFFKQSTILAATNALLTAGDPASDIVQVFVSDFNANGYASAAVNGANPTCFDINSCDLYIGAVLVPLSPSTLTFNPTITLSSIGAMVPSVSQLGMVAIVGLIGFAAVRAMRVKPV